MLTAMDVLAEVSEFPTSSEQENHVRNDRICLPAWNTVDMGFSIPAILVIAWFLVASR